MPTIILPPDVAGPLAAEAVRRGTTPELLAVDAVRRVLPALPAPADDPLPAEGEGTLLDFLGLRVGSVAGTGEAFSQDCGRRLADDLAAARQARP